MNSRQVANQQQQIGSIDQKLTIQSVDISNMPINQNDLQRIQLMSAPEFNNNGDNQLKKSDKKFLKSRQNSPRHNVRFDMGQCDILNSANIPYSPDLMINKNEFEISQDQQSLQNMLSPETQQKQRKAHFSIKHYKELKQQAAQKNAEKKYSVKDEYYSIMSRLENVQPKDLKSKIKNLIDDSYQQRNLADAQKLHNTIKTQINDQKYKSPIKKIKKLDLQTLEKSSLNDIAQDTFDKEKEIQQKTFDSTKSNNSKQPGQLQLSAIQIAYQKRIQQEKDKQMREKMIDLKLNHMVTNLQERLGFVTKKQKMDHVMYRLAQTIEKKVKTEQNDINSKIQKQEYYIVPYQDDEDNFSDKKQDKIQHKNVLPQKFDQKYVDEHSGVKQKSVNVPKLSKFASPRISIQSVRLNLQNQTQVNSPQESSRHQSHSHQQCYSNRFKSLSPKKNQQEQPNPYKEIIKDKILDKTPRPSTYMYDDNYIDQNLVMEFLQSLYSDKDWTSIATDEQFEKIMSLLSEYYGMKDMSENKYKKLPRYILAQQEKERKTNKIDENHIGSDIEGKSRQGSKQRNRSSSRRREETLIGVEKNQQDDDNNINIFSEEEYDSKQNKEDKLFARLINQSHLDSTVMKEKFVMERYTSYLNKCLFITSDEFIKRKFKAFIEKKNPKKSENFFTRMQKDQERRTQHEKQILEQANQNLHQNIKYNTTVESVNMQELGSGNAKQRKFLDIPNHNLGYMTKKNVSSKQSENSINMFSDYQVVPQRSLGVQDIRMIKKMQEQTNSAEVKLQSQKQATNAQLNFNYAKMIQSNYNDNNKKEDINSKILSATIQEYDNEETGKYQINIKKPISSQQMTTLPLRQAKSQWQNQLDDYGNDSNHQLKILNQSNTQHLNQKNEDSTNNIIQNSQENKGFNNRTDTVSTLRRSQMRNLQHHRFSDPIDHIDLIEEKIKQLQEKVMAKKIQQSPIKIRFN